MQACSAGKQRSTRRNVACIAAMDTWRRVDAHQLECLGALLPHPTPSHLLASSSRTSSCSPCATTRQRPVKILSATRHSPLRQPPAPTRGGMRNTSISLCTNKICSEIVQCNLRKRESELEPAGGATRCCRRRRRSRLAAARHSAALPGSDHATHLLQRHGGFSQTASSQDGLKKERSAGPKHLRCRRPRGGCKIVLQPQKAQKESMKRRQRLRKDPRMRALSVSQVSAHLAIDPAFRWRDRASLRAAQGRRCPFTFQGASGSFSLRLSTDFPPHSNCWSPDRYIHIGQHVLECLALPPPPPAAACAFPRSPAEHRLSCALSLTRRCMQGWDPVTSAAQFFSFAEAAPLVCVYITAPWWVLGKAANPPFLQALACFRAEHRSCVGSKMFIGTTR